MNIKVHKNCPFCKTPAQHWDLEKIGIYFRYDCPVCKLYFITKNTIDKINSLKHGPAILNCISENIKSNSADYPVITSWHLQSEQEMPPMNSDVSVKRLDHYLSLPIVHADKTTNILMQLAKNLEQSAPFEETSLSFRDLYYLKVMDFKEALVWLNELNNDSLIKSPYLDEISKSPSYTPLDTHLKNCKIQITPKGWAAVYSKQQTLNSKKVFIAMHFNWGNDLNHVKNEFIEALKDGCKDCGYDADIVTQHHTEPIMDKIIASIKESKFVIADFTYNNRGAYFEAGYARALNIPVIHTVMEGHTDDEKDDKKHLHFDIQQINYIKWSDPKEVREKIRDRIKAVIN